MKTGQPQNLKGYGLATHIGEGGFGAVYIATQTSIGREVAIKIIKPAVANKPEFIRRFETEAQLIARLEHPHITPLYDYWRDTTGAYLVMRYLKGGSLRNMLDDNGALELNTISMILDQLASALDFAHRQQVIHRDIKPDNILLDEEGNVYLADFGIAKDLAIDNSHTNPDAVVGSLDYISPEQARSEAVTARTDIYSLGVVLYEMMTGDHPFKEVSSVERLYKHINDPLPEIGTLGDVSDMVLENLNVIIETATQKDPVHRYPDVLSLALAFREAVGIGDTQDDLSIAEQLTMREHEVLQLIAEGLSNREIADSLFITVSGVKFHLRNAYKKLGVNNRVQAIVRSRELDLITTERIADHLSTDGQTLQPSTLSLPEPENPYKGLLAFQYADTRDFFGRDELSDNLVKRLGENEKFNRFLAVVGPSGSGKSSLARAGIMPRIKSGKLLDSKNWFVADMIPGARPLDALEIALIGQASNQPINLHEQLSRDKFGLVRAAELILPKDNSQLVIIIDQFEEVFTQVADEESRQHFLDLLHATVIDKQSRVYIIVTLRADYYDRPLHYPEFGEMLRSRMDTILPLSAKGLERAISGPAERVGVAFETGLVAQIVSEMNYQAGALPLLQYALKELFDRRDGRLLTHSAYQEIGGAVGALANRADEIFLSFSDNAQSLAQQLFLRLVTLGEGAEDTRRRTPFVELLSLTDKPDLMEEIIDTFANYRLLSLDTDEQTRQPTVEVAHEAILREWDRLRLWLNESRDDIRQERTVASAADDWEKHQRDNSYLLRGSRLEQTETWASITRLTLTPLEHDFIQKSIVKREVDTRAEAERLQREQAQEKRSQNLLRALVAVFALALVVSAGFGVTTQQSLTASERIRLAAQAQNVLNTGASGEVPALLALRSLALGYSPEADAALLQALDRGFPIREFVGHTDFISWANISRDGLLAVTVGSEGVLIIWDMQTGEEIRRITGQASDFWVAEFAPDRQTLVTGGINGVVRLWDTNSGVMIRDLATYPYRIWGSRFSPDGQSIAVSGDEIVYLIDVQTGEEIQQFVGRDAISMGIGFSVDGQYICAGGLDGKNHIWNTTTGTQLRVFEGHDGFTACESFSPDGQYVLTAGEDNTVIMWDIASGRQIHHLDQHVGNAGSAVFSQNGQYIISNDNGGNAYLWDASTGQLLNQYRGHTGSVPIALMSPDLNYILTVGDDSRVLLWETFDIIEPHSFSVPILPHTTQAQLIDYQVETATLTRVLTAGQVYTWDTNNGGDETLLFNIGFNTVAELSQENQFIIAGYENGEVRLWDTISRNSILRFEAHNSRVQALALAPNSQTAITAGADNTLRLWNTTAGSEIHQFDGETQGIHAIAYAPDGLTIATGDTEGILRIWDISTGIEIQQFEGHTNTILAVAFSPDGQSVVTGSTDNKAILWDIDSGHILQTFVGHTNQVTSVDFSEDGSRILTGSFDQTARLWNIESGNTIRYFSGHVTPVTAVALDPNGEYAFTADNADTYRWLINLEDVIDLACSRVPRDLRSDERILYNIMDDTATCVEGNPVTVRTELTWTPYPAQPMPVWTPIPDEPAYVIEFEFLGDEEVIACCTMPPFVFVRNDENTVSGFTELNDDVLEAELFSANVPVDIGFSPPFSSGPYPLGQPLGFSVEDWLTANGYGIYTETNGRATLMLEFDHLVSDGLYTLWCVEQSNVPNWQVIEELPCGALDGSENVFTADANGFASFSIEIDAFPPPRQERFYGIAIAYHSDGQTHGTSVGEHGMTAHVQLFHDFLPGS